MTPIRPGSDGEPLPPGTLIFRVGKDAQLNPQALRQRRALEIMFQPSSKDERSPGQRLSVWVEELTLADEAWSIMGRNPDNTVVACLNIDDVRAIVPPQPFRAMDVEWEQARLGDGSPIPHPGAEGHVGITGLCQGGKGKTDSAHRRNLRSKLADAANVSPVPVPHNLPEEHIRVAAYFVYENRGSGPDSAAADWVAAIRQLRRARVREYREAQKAG